MNSSSEADQEQKRSISKEIGLRVAAIRERKGLTKSELAKRIGLDMSSFSKVEKGLANLSIPSLYRTAQELGVAPSDLVSGAQLLEGHSRFPMLGRLGDDFASNGSGVSDIALPTEGLPPEAVAFQAADGYLVAVPIDGNPVSRRSGDRIVFSRVDARLRKTVLRLGTFYHAADVGLSQEQRRALLEIDQSLAAMAAAQSEIDLLQALYDQNPELEVSSVLEPEPKAAPDLGWISIAGQERRDRPTHEAHMPFCSQLILERWLVVAQLTVCRHA